MQIHILQISQIRNSHLIAHKYIWKNCGEHIMLSIQVRNPSSIYYMVSCFKRHFLLIDGFLLCFHAVWEVCITTFQGNVAPPSR